MPPQGLELREQFPQKASRCFPTRKIMDACKTSGIFLSLCRQLNCFETARQPLSVLVAWDRWCILWSLTATSLKWSTKCNVGFFPPFFFFWERQNSLSVILLRLKLPKGIHPKKGHTPKGTRTSNFRQERRTFKRLSCYFYWSLKGWFSIR